MNDIITIIKKEMFRFFGDRRLVFTTIIMPGLLIYVMYSLLGQGMMKELSTDANYVAKGYEVNMPKELEPLLNNEYFEWENWNGDMEEKDRILREIADGNKDLLLYFPKDFMRMVEAYQAGMDPEKEAPNIEIYFNSEKSNSFTSYKAVVNMLDAWEEGMVNKFDVNRSQTEGEFGEFDQASEQGIMGKMLSGLLPMLIMTFIFSGCQGVAPESIAGEKERGTIATLLVTPLKRGALALGKVISLSVIALMAGISSFLGTILSLPKMMGSDIDLDVITYGVSDYALLFFVIISTVLVMVSIISIVSANARSVKEATTMMTPFMLIVVLSSFLPMIGVDFGGKLSYCIPLYNSVKVMNGIFGFQPDLTMALVTIGVNVVITGLLVMVLTKMFGNENVMFGK